MSPTPRVLEEFFKQSKNIPSPSRLSKLKKVLRLNLRPYDFFIEGETNEMKNAAELGLSEGTTRLF
jgi:hypothetical protein